MRKAKYLSLLGATLMIAGPMAIATSAASGYGANANDERGNADVQGSWLCGNGVSSAKISLGGTMTLRGIGIAVHMDATGKGTGKVYDNVNTDGIDLAFSQNVEIPKRNVGGNPYVFFQPTNKGGDALDMAPILLGRCKGNGSVGSGRGQGQALAGISTLANLSASGCTNSGSSISLNRNHNRGIHGKVILSLKSDPNEVRRQSTAEIDQVTMSFGDIAAPKATAMNGVGGNPTISTLFFKVNRNAVKTGIAPTTTDSGTTWLDADGNATEVFSADASGNKGWHNMGRCSEIGK